jgi:glycosyltransferase involved in cell wall biosynthesis
MDKPRLLFLCSRFPWPLDKGDKLRAYHQVKELSRHFRIILFCLSIKKVSSAQISHLSPFCEYIEVFPISPLRAAIQLLKGVLDKRPFQVVLFAHKNAFQRCDACVEKYLPRVVFAQMVRTAEYARKYTIFTRCLDYMDALSAGMERRISIANPFIRPFVKSEFKRLQRFESELQEDFKYKFIISDQDRMAIRHSNNSNIFVIPNGISASFLNASRNTQAQVDIIFTGNMSYKPNEKAAFFLVKEVFPLLPPSTRIKICGKSPGRSLRNLSSPRIDVSGWVSDMSVELSNARLMAAPMFLGSGLQNKLLEAMACGLPCITTSMANNALGATPETEILIADTAGDFAHQITRLLSDDVLANNIGIAGKAYVKNNFDWQHIGENLAGIIKGQVT